MPLPATWYFDVLSPYAYLQLPDLGRMASQLDVQPKPVLLAALLNQSGTKGPAEIPAKRLHTYRQCAWLARQQQRTLRMPPRHPFNPLAALRLLCALGPTIEQATIASRFVFEEGQDPSTPEGLAALGARLGVRDAQALATSPAAKQRLRDNTDEAIARGVWGVPTFVVGGEIFWGADSFAMLLDYLRDPQLFESPDMKPLATLPVGVTRS